MPFEIRTRHAVRPQEQELIEISSTGDFIPLQENWTQRWCTFRGHLRNAYEKIYNFEVYDDDIFVVTFPKCGTTWMQEAAWMLLNDLNYEKAKELHLVRRSIFMDLSGFFKDFPLNTIEMARDLPRPRLIKTHLPAHLMPYQIWQKKAKIIYCSRNIKDVAVSYYHFHVGMGTWCGSMEDFVGDLINKDIIYTPYWPHILDFWHLRNELQIFFTTYEQMKQDLGSVLKALNEFIGKPPLRKKQLDELKDYLSFEKMKDNKKTNPTDILKSNIAQALPELEFMRRGIAGAYRDELSIELQKQLNDYTAESLKGHGVTEEDIFGAV